MLKQLGQLDLLLSNLSIVRKSERKTHQEWDSAADNSAVESHLQEVLDLGSWPAASLQQ